MVDAMVVDNRVVVVFVITQIRRIWELEESDGGVRRRLS